MTQLETMRRGKLYLEKLAQGVDPITDQEIREDSVLNNVHLARCFFYVSGVLEQVIANGGTAGLVGKTMEFAITQEQLTRVRLPAYPVRISEFAEALYQVVENPEMKKPDVKKITDWLLSRDLMTQMTGEDGKLHRVPTELGLRMGMTTRLRKTRDGEYRAVYYDKNMQKFLLEHMGEILHPEQG